jgi:hypothetical protein
MDSFFEHINNALPVIAVGSLVILFLLVFVLWFNETRRDQ